MVWFLAIALHGCQTLSNVGWKMASNREVKFTEGNIKLPTNKHENAKNEWKNENKNENAKIKKDTLCGLKLFREFLQSKPKQRCSRYFIRRAAVYIICTYSLYFWFVCEVFVEVYVDKKIITHCLKDMNFMLSWQKQCFTHLLCSLMKYYLCHLNVQ